MKFLEIEVKTTVIIHGYDEFNRELSEEIHDAEFVKKLLPVERIISISEQFILFSSSHERVMCLEYKGKLEALKSRLKLQGVTII